MRAEVATLRAYAAEDEARLAENMIARFEVALKDAENEVLSVQEAARRTGRSRDTIERAIRSNRLPNAGRQGKPKVRAGDLGIFPRRIVAPEESAAYDVAADVRDLLVRRRGG
jgi:excisionase family DNA binding protein